MAILSDSDRLRARRSRHREPDREAIDAMYRLLGAVVLLAVVTPMHSVAQDDSGYTEYDVKAAFLFNFARFVTWPVRALPDTSTEIVIGLYGSNPFGNTLQLIVEGKHINQHGIRVVEIDDPSQALDCHIVFVPFAERDQMKRVLDRVRGQPVLTVSEVDGFLEEGGIVNFVVRESRVRFEVNLPASDRASIEISSKLLRIAERVRQHN